MYCTRQRASTCIGFACCPITFKSASMNNMSVLRSVQQRRELQGEDIYFLLKIKLGTVVPLELEKHHNSYIHPALKLYPLIYSIYGNYTHSYIIQLLMTHSENQNDIQNKHTKINVVPC
jgi:hypothetical protein